MPINIVESNLDFLCHSFDAVHCHDGGTTMAISKNERLIRALINGAGKTTLEDAMQGWHFVSFGESHEGHANCQGCSTKFFRCAVLQCSYNGNQLRLGFSCWEKVLRHRLSGVIAPLTEENRGTISRIRAYVRKHVDSEMILWLKHYEDTPEDILEAIREIEDLGYTTRLSRAEKLVAYYMRTRKFPPEVLCDTKDFPFHGLLPKQITMNLRPFIDQMIARGWEIRLKTREREADGERRTLAAGVLVSEKDISIYRQTDFLPDEVFNRLLNAGERRGDWTHVCILRRAHRNCVFTLSAWADGAHLLQALPQRLQIRTGPLVDKLGCRDARRWAEAAARFAESDRDEKFAEWGDALKHPCTIRGLRLVGAVGSMDGFIYFMLMGSLTRLRIPFVLTEKDGSFYHVGHLIAGSISECTLGTIPSEMCEGVQPSWIQEALFRNCGLYNVSPNHPNVHWKGFIGYYMVQTKPKKASFTISRDFHVSIDSNDLNAWILRACVAVIEDARLIGNEEEKVADRRVREDDRYRAACERLDRAVQEEPGTYLKMTFQQGFHPTRDETQWESSRNGTKYVLSYRSYRKGQQLDSSPITVKVIRHLVPGQVVLVGRVGIFPQMQDETTGEVLEYGYG